MRHGVARCPFPTLMDLVQLKYFLKVVELRSMTKAAQALHVAQPAITRQIRQLEEELGVELLHRHSRGAEPTEAGLQLQVGAQAMLRLASETRATVQATTQQVIGTVRVGFPPSVGAALVAQAAAAFRCAHPMAELILDEGYSARLRDALLSDRLDIAVLTDAPANPLLHQTPLYEESLWVFYPHGSTIPSQTRGENLPLRSLRDQALIQPGPDNTLRQLIEHAARTEGFVLNVVMQSESLAVTRGLLASSVGAHVSPYTALQVDLQAGALDGQQIEGMWVTRSLARRVDRPLTLAQQKFIGALQDQVGALKVSAPGMIRGG